MTRGIPHCPGPGCKAKGQAIDQYVTAGVGDDVVRLCYCKKCHSFFKAGPDWEILSGTLEDIAKARAKSKKIYIASSFSLIPQVEKVARMLERGGHTITVRWWSREYQTEGGQLVETTELKKQYASLSPDDFHSRPETSKSYYADLDGIDDAHALVLIGPPIANRSALVGGNIELGYGLARGIPCFGLGAFMNSAMYHGLIRCKTSKELMAYLEDD